jgi:hypothetical protein
MGGLEGADEVGSGEAGTMLVRRVTVGSWLVRMWKSFCSRRVGADLQAERKRRSKRKRKI